MNNRKIVITEPRHKAFIDDLKVVLGKHANNLTGLELLAVTSHLVGSIVAFQDQTAITPDYAMDVVARNIELGNQEAIKALNNTVGNA